ncbi:hypothetical protein PH210_14720 [Paenibacillus sp. BSR1-1]|uniref:hypothetical protein n=1 Tax=Paenibacillus sp. BSR1-1 TaxID=3020845 RepID=UPI0025B1F37F|nr:hypothetical protein [Paenibacillus sp. BSR1-1]MDN3017448.1 hypothetical protein [Paenibacillus sp. BSR1-1]
MSEKEKRLQLKTSIILGKDTSQMTLNNIIEELIYVIEAKKKTTNSSNCKNF